MATLITSAGSTITPTAIDGYTSSRAPATILHTIPGRANGSPDASLRPAGMRHGTIRMMFAGATAEADSLAAQNLLATAATFNLTSTDITGIAMTFVVPEGSGEITRDLDDETRAAWLVDFPYQELVP